jgi:hypothetical protein
MGDRAIGTAGFSQPTLEERWRNAERGRRATLGEFGDQVGELRAGQAAK